MNGSIRVSAKTVDDAITEALIQLGVTSDRLEYEVIEKGSAGFLGIGMKQAVIEARRKPEPKEEKVEEPVVEEPVRVEPKKVEAVQPQKAAAEKKADEPQKAAFEKAVEKEVKEEVQEVDMMEQTNKSMSLLMPIMSISISLVAPLGLALYWLTSNVLMILERIFMNKYFKSKEEKENAK